MMFRTVPYGDHMVLTVKHKGKWDPCCYGGFVLSELGNSASAYASRICCRIDDISDDEYAYKKAFSIFDDVEDVVNVDVNKKDFNSIFKDDKTQWIMARDAYNKAKRNMS